MRGIGSIKYVQNGFQNPIDVFVHLIIPKSQHQISHRLQDSRPIRFISARVLPSINFYYEMSIVAEEIYDISIDRHLSPELQAMEPSVAQL